MDRNAQKRNEPRLSYRCLVWFGADVTQALFPGLMEDISSGGLAFTYAEPGRLHVEQRLTVRFSLPRFDIDNRQATVGITRTGRIRSITATGDGTYRIGLQFDTPLSFKPVEEAARADVCHAAAVMSFGAPVR
jgi:hypothetical protein